MATKKKEIREREKAILEDMPTFEKKNTEETSLRPNPAIVIGRVVITDIIGTMIKK